ncbi:MAG: hypothetical protein QXW44_05045 [Pyrobaculum sp.]
MSKVAGMATGHIYMPPRPDDIKHSLADVRRALGLGWAPVGSSRKKLKNCLIVRMRQCFYRGYTSWMWIFTTSTD